VVNGRYDVIIMGNITFEQIKETKDNIKGIRQFVNKNCNRKTFYSEKQSISSDIMGKINILGGKYYKPTIKADLKTMKNCKGYGGEYKLQQGRSGFGYCSSWRTNITLYTGLFDNSCGVGFLVDIIDNKKMFNIVKNNLNVNGQNVLDIIKNNYEKNTISKPNKISIYYPINISQEERETFKVKKDNVFIKIFDAGYTLYITIEQNKNPNISRKITNNDYDDDDDEGSDTIFSLNKLSNSDEDEAFLRYLFINNHKNEFDEAIKQYISKSKEENDRWINFRDDFIQDTAKYFMLGLL